MSNQQLSQRKQQIDTVRGALEKLKPQMSLALPRHLTPERLLRVTMTAVQGNPSLLDCDRTSLFASVLTCAQLGLEPDGVLGQAYLVPFKGKVQFIPGYRGLITLARNSGEVSSIQAHEVCQNDTFDYAYGLEETLYHKPAEGERGEVTHFYAYAKFKDGGHVFVVLTRTEVESVRDNSEGFKAFKAGRIRSNPWDSHFVPMGCKTAIRRLAKWLPLTVQRAATIEDAYERGQHARTDEYGEVVIDSGTGESDAEESGGNGATSRMDALAGGGQGEGAPGQDASGGPGAGDAQGADQKSPTIDADRVPWDSRIHSVNRTLTDDGRWRRKRGVSDEEHKRVTEELLQARGEQQQPATGPDPEDPVTMVVERMEQTQDRDTLDEIADEALNGTDVDQATRERLTRAYSRNCERLETAEGTGSGGRATFSDDD